jgi:outer membrane protein TolC
VAHLLSDVRRLQAAGVESSLSQSTVEAQQLELLHKQVDLEATIEELNHQLIDQLGAEPPPDSRLWPDANLKVDPIVPNVAEAQELARRQRCDLAALRLAACCDVEVMRTLLGQANAGLGLSLKSCHALAALHVAANLAEGDIRGEQISAAADQQERTLMHDIARSIAALEAHGVQIGLSRSRLEALQQQHERLEKKREIDATAAFEARKARLDVLAAEQDLLHDVIEWKLAQAKLRELQGELASECGYLCNPGCP